MMRYKRLAEQIIQDCLNNIYAPGSKMPSLRKMAHIQNVSLTTAQNCYHYLEELGWIVSKPQSGFYVSRPFGTHDAPKPLHFTSQITSLNTQDFSGNVLSEVFPHSVLGISQISPDLMPTLPLQRCFKRAISESSRHLHQYPNIQGIEALRNALSHHFSAYGLPLPSDDWVITNGCINAVYLAVEATTQEGDAIAITSPCFGGLLEMLAMMKRNVVELPCNNTGIDLQQLEHHIQNGTVQAGLFSTTHMNPLGLTCSIEQKQALAALANRYHFPIIEDDVYMELSHTNHVPLPAKYWDKQGDIVWCASVSKTLSASVRTGWCVAGKFKQAILARMAISQMGMNTQIQAGLARFIQAGYYKSHLNKLRVYLGLNVQQYVRFLQANLPKDCAISQPAGGVVLWIQVPHLDTQKLKVRAQNAGIDIRIGSDFTTLSHYQDCFRINTGWPWDASIEAQLQQLCQWIDDNKKGS